MEVIGVWHGPSEPESQCVKEVLNVVNKWCTKTHESESCGDTIYKLGNPSAICYTSCMGYEQRIASTKTDCICNRRARETALRLEMCNILQFRHVARTWGTKSSKITQSFVAPLSSLCGCLGSCQPSNGYPAHIAHKIIVNLDWNMEMIRYFCRWLQSRGRQNEALVMMGQFVITTYCTARSGIFFYHKHLNLSIGRT